MGKLCGEAREKSNRPGLDGLQQAKQNLAILIINSLQAATILLHSRIGSSLREWGMDSQNS